MPSTGWAMAGLCIAVSSGCGWFGDGEPKAEYVNSDLYVGGNLYVTGKVVIVDENGEAVKVAAGSDASAHSEGQRIHAQGSGGLGLDSAHGAGSAPDGSDAEHPAVEVVQWGYDGENGPAEWGGLHSRFEICASGKAQSPIDIDHATNSTMGPIDFAYTQMPLSLANDGHTVMVDGARGGWIEFAAKRYQLQSFHFHSPSEHRVRGRNYDMVVHLTHQSSDGEVLVIGVPFVRGRKNLALEGMWKHFPLRAGDASTHPETIYSVESLLPERRSYYSYIGSRTEPPCTEGVRWVFLKTPLTVSAAQIARFTRAFPASVRPVQPLNGRTVGQGR